MLRRLHPEQPESFAFTPANREWARAQIAKFPEGRQASAIIPLLWRAQEQEGWLTRPAIEHVADMLGMAHIRALEVATFYFMFQLHPVGTVAHVQVCGTTPCMLRGAEDLADVCRARIAERPHQRSACGRFSWEEVECLGACANAPMVQIGKDYYEDLTPAALEALIAAFERGDVPVPGPQNGRYASEPLGGLTSLTEFDSGHTQFNASVQRAVDIGDTVRRIDGTEVPGPSAARPAPAPEPASPAPRAPAPAAGLEVDATGATVAEAPSVSRAKPVSRAEPVDVAPAAPARLDAPRGGRADDLKRIRGIGPKLETLLNEMGYYHLDQIAAWTVSEQRWVDENIEGFRGRATREDWVGQAQTLVLEGRPGHETGGNDAGQETGTTEN